MAVQEKAILLLRHNKVVDQTGPKAAAPSFLDCLQEVRRRRTPHSLSLVIGSSLSFLTVPPELDVGEQAVQ